ncbi:Uncharacterized protein Rs2_45734 [Raphanus sativus]|nr:Uncharacterized protein Rs2_45734 [Raphanus sativus]
MARTRSFTRRRYFDKPSLVKGIDLPNLSLVPHRCFCFHRDPVSEDDQRRFSGPQGVAFPPCSDLWACVWPSRDGFRDFSEGLPVCYTERCCLGCDEVEFSGIYGQSRP